MSENNAQPPISRNKFTAVIAAIMFILILILFIDGFGRNKRWVTFSNIEKMETYLARQPENTPDNPRKIKLNFNYDMYIDMHNINSFLSRTNQYIYLDLSGSKITTVKNNAFASFYPYSEVRLTGIILPKSVTVIREEAFKDCRSLVSVTLPDGLTGIEESAFYNCYKLTNIKIPDSVTVIGQNAFSNCAGLTDITIPDNVTAIEQKAFKGCENLVSVKMPNRITDIRDSVFSGCRNLTDITIPDRVTCIGDFAFFGCESLVSIAIPNNVTEIGRGAFKHCYNLTDITIPDSVTRIKPEAFYNCYNLVSVTFKGTMKKELKYYTDDEEKSNYRRFEYYADDDEENINYGKFEYFDDEENERDKFYYKSVFDEAFIGDLHEKFYEEDAEYGTPGTYAAVESYTPFYRGTRWIRQP